MSARPAQPGRVLGIDPGLRATGWGVVERRGPGLQLIAVGCVRPPADAPFPARLAAVYRGVVAALEQHAPEAVAVEEAFADKNVRSAIRLGEARAVCILAAQLAGREVHEIPPALVKKAVAGHGRAGKDSVRDAVVRALGLDPARALRHDESDALGLAITVLGRLELAGEHPLGLPLGRRRSRGRGRWTAADVEGLLGSGGARGRREGEP